MVKCILANKSRKLFQQIVGHPLSSNSLMTFKRVAFWLNQFRIYESQLSRNGIHIYFKVSHISVESLILVPGNRLRDVSDSPISKPNPENAIKLRQRDPSHLTYLLYNSIKYAILSQRIQNTQSILFRVSCGINIVPKGEEMCSAAECWRGWMIMIHL